MLCEFYSVCRKFLGARRSLFPWNKSIKLICDIDIEDLKHFEKKRKNSFGNWRDFYISARDSHNFYCFSYEQIYIYISLLFWGKIGSEHLMRDIEHFCKKFDEAFKRRPIGEDHCSSIAFLWEDLKLLCEKPYCPSVRNSIASQWKSFFYDDI